MRPILHFTAETGWINDPHAITYRDGRFHLFYQYAPDTLVWSPHCHWGHAVSPDLFRFDRLPPGRRDEAYRVNAGGWAKQLENIASHVASV